MALNVHKLKHHDFQCKQCGIKFVEKKFLEAHMNNTHVEKLQEFKCIVCEHKAENKAYLTKHYEAKHISSGNDTQESQAKFSPKIKCKKRAIVQISKGK